MTAPNPMSAPPQITKTQMAANSDRPTEPSVSSASVRANREHAE